MNLIVDGANVHAVSVGAPAYRRDWAPNLEIGHRVLLGLVSSFPDFHRSVIRASRDELNSRTSCHCPVDGVDDFAVGAYSSEFLSGSYIGDGEGMVCGHAVQELRV